MKYVVVDFEWNQAYKPQASQYKKLPMRLLGEIIEIGAVRLNDDLTPGEEFSVDVRPVYFRTMHFKVKKLTGFDNKRLNRGLPFKEAMEKFHEWCGDGVTFITWGRDDRNIMEQNVELHGLDWSWISGWVNLQVIYGLQVSGQRGQQSLASAMEHFGIEQTRQAHDALGDAYNTGLLCSHIDLGEGIKQYASYDGSGELPLKSSDTGPEPLSHECLAGFTSKDSAFKDPRISSPPCPRCGESLTLTRWVDQGDRRYMALGECRTDGQFLLRMRFKPNGGDTLSVNRLIYAADEDMLSFFKMKVAQARKRSRLTHMRRKKKLHTRKKGIVD